VGRGLALPGVAGDQKAGVVCSPPPLIAAQIWAQSIQNQMVERYFKGEAMTPLAPG
jgi:hypothetical protein